MKIGSLIEGRDFNKIPSIKDLNKISELDFILVDKKSTSFLSKKNKKVFLGELNDLLQKKIENCKGYFEFNICEKELIKKLVNIKSKEEEQNIFKTFKNYEKELFLLEEKTSLLEKKIKINKEGSIELRGLREYIIRLLGVNTLEQLVYETESLRILKHKGIKISLIYSDESRGVLCTRSTLRKINGINEISFKSSKKSDLKLRKDLANILSRPVLNNFKIFSEEKKSGEKFYSIIESQYEIKEEEFFINILKRLLFTNFIRVIQSEKLFKMSSLLSQAFNQIQNTSILITPNHEIIVSNREGSVGRKCYEYMFSLNKPCGNCPMKESKKSKTKGNREKNKLLESNYIVHSSNIKGSDHDFFLHIYETEKDSLKRESIEIQRGKLQSLGIVARALTHELNNPLTGIRELSYDLSLDQKGQPKEDLEDVCKASKRSLKIIESLKRFSSQKIEFERIELGNVISDALVFTKVLTRSTRVGVSLDDDVWISGSETLLGQMIFNIIKNSVQAMNGEGSLNIELNKNGKDCILSFIDSGPGFPKHMSDVSLFGTVNKKEGTGFGLFLVNEFVKLHKGTLEFGNLEQAKGAFFKISFPME